MATVTATPSPLPEHLPERGRVQLLPLGTLTPRDRRGPWHVTDAAAIIAASQARVQRGMPVDLDHAIDRKQNAPAAGWIKALSHDAEGIWAEIEWTPMGKARIDAREYRFISPTLIISNDGTVLRIDRAGLTNDPALEMKALCANEGDARMDQTDRQQLELLEDFLVDLRLALDLSEDAAMSAILTAARRPEPAPRSDQLGQPVVEQLASAMFDGWAQRRDVEVEQRIGAAMKQGRLPPALAGWARKVCAANTSLFDEFIQDAPNLSYLGERHIAGDVPGVRQRSDNPVFTQLGISPE